MCSFRSFLLFPLLPPEIDFKLGKLIFLCFICCRYSKTVTVKADAEHLPLGSFSQLLLSLHGSRGNPEVSLPSTMIIMNTSGASTDLSEKKTP